MLLSKESFRGWEEIQEKYDSYKASLGPWDNDETIEYLKEEYPELYIKNEKKIINFLKSGNIELTL
jgi:hypothetical protein